MFFGLSHWLLGLVLGRQSRGGVPGEVDLKRNAGGIRGVSRFYCLDIEPVDLDHIATGHIAIFDDAFLDQF